MDMSGLEVRPGSKTFRWHGRYHDDVNDRDTVAVELNVLAESGAAIPDAFLEEVDRVARDSHRSRSELVREALHRYLAEWTAYPTPRDDPQVREAVARLRRRPVRGDWDSTREIRGSRDRVRRVVDQRGD